MIWIERLIALLAFAVLVGLIVWAIVVALAARSALEPPL